MFVHRFPNKKLIFHPIAKKFGIYVFIFFIGGFIFIGFANLNQIDAKPQGFWTVIFVLKTLIEVIASIYAIFYIFVAINYSKPVRAIQSKRYRQRESNIVVGYLCCNDFDDSAFESIVVYFSKQGIPIWIHDDSTDPAIVQHVDSTAKTFRIKYGNQIVVLRRNNKEGGKPGAVNNLSKSIPPNSEYLVLCDSDSYFFKNQSFDEIMHFFEDPLVALVQCKNIGVNQPGDSKGFRSLSLSIDFYDAFVHFLDRYGWSPFLGHNAVLRISSFREVNGFTLDDFADDIDYSVKLRLNGYTIKYARDIECGERHPTTYEALRLRTLKWSYGCTQILLRWSWSVIKCNHISATGKLTFFLTVGYYHFQLLLLLYLGIFYLVLPFYDPHMGGMFRLLISSAFILLLTFMPSITFFLKHDNILRWPKIAACWGLTYGSQDFVIARGISKCLYKQKFQWISTNTRSESAYFLHFLPEVLFGISIVIVSLVQNYKLLILPTTILFAGKFLVAPLLNKHVFRIS